MLAASALTHLRADFASSYDVTEVAATVLDQAIALTQRHTLRAYDAIQLATALSVASERSTGGRPPLTFLCADARLRAAAAAEGLATDDPNAHP